MYRTASAILAQDADIADAIQETILTCWGKNRHFTENRYFKTWMVRILINKCKTFCACEAWIVCVRNFRTGSKKEYRGDRS